MLISNPSSHLVPCISCALTVAILFVQQKSRYEKSGPNDERGHQRIQRVMAIALSFTGISLLQFYSVQSQSRILNTAFASSSSRRNGISNSNPHGPPTSYEITTTNYGWTSSWASTQTSKSFSRRFLTGEFFSATQAHLRYNASAWLDLESNPDPIRQIIAIMDVDTCIELNYPFYGGREWWRNLEFSKRDEKFHSVVRDSCDYIAQAAQSPALKANASSRLVILDCSGSRRFYLHKTCSNPGIFDNNQVIVAYMSVDKESVRSKKAISVGLPPPAIKSVDMTTEDRNGIDTCQKRRYLFSFQGRGGHGREALLKFDSYDDMYIRIREQKSYIGEIKTEVLHSDSTPVSDTTNYTDVMKQSIFVAAPRGDNLFSYRFSEILSAGSVPVVYADGWLPPFNEKVVDWSKCAVFIPEKDFDKTRDILLTISEEEQCNMQKCALHIWDNYASSRAGWLRGLIEVAESSVT